MWTSSPALGAWVAVLILLHVAQPGFGQQICGETLLKDNGTLSSPNYPANYPNNKHCIWTITAPDDEIIDLRFSGVNLDGFLSQSRSTECPDYVNVYDGDHVQAPLLVKLCRSKTNEELSNTLLRSTGNTMLVEFFSDGEGQRSGFLASYWMHECEEFMFGSDYCTNSCNCDRDNSVSCNNTDGTCNCKPGWTSEDCSVDFNECVDLPVEPCPGDYQECTNTEGSFTCRCKDGLQMNSDGKCQVSSSCGTSSSCSHTCVDLPRQGQVCYCPNDMKLEENRLTCVDCNSTSFGKECRLPCNCVAENTLSCDNTTGGCICKDGWTSDDCSEDIDECDLERDRCLEDNKVCVNSPGSYDCIVCSFVLSGPSGIVQSPNYPNEYSNGLDCTWTITAAGDDETVTLEFSNLDMDYRYPGRSCTSVHTCHDFYDHLKIYDGADDSAPLLGVICSNAPLVRSSGKSMHIVYHARRRNSFIRGFKGTYRIQNYPSYRSSRTDKTGIIMSPSYSNGGANAFSVWTITVDTDSVVTFSLTDLDLGSTDCDKSHISFYDGTIGNPLRKKVCPGDKRFDNVSSTDNVMTIVYFSDGSSNGKGFKGSYITNACKCYEQGTTSCDSPLSGRCKCSEGWKGGNCCTDIDECEPDPDPCPEHSTCHNTVGSYLCYCNNGTAVKSTDVCPDCKFDLRDQSGEINSPGYPSFYGSYISCSWTIVRQAGDDVVSLRFSSFDIFSRYGCQDVVEVYDGRDSSSPLIGKYCGNNVPELLRTTNEDMHIVFRSDYYHSSNGFQASYAVHKCPKNQYGLTNSCPNSCSCNEDHTDTCDNVYGICICKPGWMGSGCAEDQDECRNQRICPDNSKCHNEPRGSYTCKCRPGYSMNTDNQCKAKQCGLGCSHSCYTSNGRETCTCPQDLYLHPNGKTCRVKLYPNGKKAGDTTVDPSDSSSDVAKNRNKIYTSKAINFDIGLSFGDPDCQKAPVKTAYAGLNGVISFGQNEIGGPNLDNTQQAVLAPMWVDKSSIIADRMYHQVYEKCDSSDFQEDESTPSPVKQEVLERAAKDVMKYAKKSEFKATSVMVVTWQQSGKDFSNQFQSVLVTGYEPHEGQYRVTDEQLTYALFIYDEGNKGKDWGLPKQMDLINVGISTGCRNYQEMTSQSLNEFNKMSSDPESDRGVMFFELGRHASPEQKCQNYLCNYIDFVTNQNYQAEIQELYQCPCSLDREGAQWTTYIDNSGNECIVIREVAKERILGDNPRNKLCCYKTTEPNGESKGDVLEGLQASTYVGGHILISDPWTKQGSVNVNDNIDAQHWCCQESSQPTKTCGRFNKVFPNLGCSNNPVIEPITILGDPHFLTLDGVKYSMNGWGEFIMINIPTEDFSLQARTGRAETSTGVLVNGTVFIAFAAQEGDDTHFQVELAASGASMVVLANGMDFTESFYNNVDFAYASNTLGVDRVDVANKITVAAVFPCGVAIKVSVGIKSLDIELEAHKRLQGKTQGLLGNFNGNPNDDFMLPNGTVLPNTLSERKILEQFATAYLVTDSTSVFVYEGGETTQDYQHPEFSPLILSEVDASRLAAAKTTCGEGNDACIYDYLVTENEEFATNTKTSLQATENLKKALRNSPPSLQVGRSAEINPWIVTAGTPSSLQFEATDDDGDAVTFELLGSTSGLSIGQQSGVLTYTASLRTSVGISVRARDSKGGYSNIVTVRVAVCPVCNNQGQCSTSEAAAQVLNKGQFMILSCQCRPAYTGVYCDSELDGCASYPCMQGQTCVDLTAAQQGDDLVGYDCGPCPAGFTEVDDICLDVDECLDENDCDQNCTNTYGSYECSCRPGYRLDLSDKITCTDINECDEGSSGCEQNCTNTDGGFDCACTDLYILNTDGKTCSPDFSTENPCQQCQHFCVRQSNRTFCECKLGYLVDSNDYNKCTDIDECSSTNNPCSQNCINTDGGYECSCDEGYTLDMDGILCVECESPYFGDNCSEICECKGRGRCDPVRGCVCNAPWSGFNCETRINRCLEPGVCPPQFVCEEGIDSFLCLCRPGYTLDNGDCVDINECLDPGFSSSCDLNVEVCINNQGNYSCTCKQGYFRNSQGICQDIDECEKQIDGCEHVCTNGPGGYKCSCYLGYALSSDRRHCESRKDICGHCSHGCVSDGSGGYTCVCPRGYSQTAQGTCQDVDECSSDSTNLCEYKDSCVNTDGGFTCSCQIGYKLDNDGRSCLACSGGTWGEECSNVCACGIGVRHCDPVLGCVCKFGFSGERCTESVNRCASGELTCQQHEECIYSAGSSYCQCQQGFEPTSEGCQDRNECLNVRLNNCDQVCTNTVGGFTCSCLEGYTYDASTNTCTDVDECQQGSSGCQHSCINVDGGYRCSCPTDLILQPDYRTCAECREADVATGECPSNCNCVESNTEHCNRTTRLCTCKQGWTSDDCSVDADECLNDPCPDNLGCNNLDGSFECVCWNGLQFSSGGNCLDCNRTLTEASGRLMTSNYPQKYDNNLYCTWTITVPESQAVISVSFHNYDVEGCPYDSAAVYDGTNTDALLLADLCGDAPPPFITSTGNSMYIVFKSDDSVTDIGFRASYTSGIPCRENSCSHICRVTSTNPWTQECSCPDYMDLDQADGQTCRDKNGCNITISDSSGTLVSPQYPGEYPTNTYCYWILQGDVGSVVTLSFSVFALEGSVGCPYDYLEMRDGNNANAPVLQRSCGDDLPSSVTTTGSAMYIIFSSDDSYTSSGFVSEFNVHRRQGASFLSF